MVEGTLDLVISRRIYHLRTKDKIKMPVTDTSLRSEVVFHDPFAAQLHHTSNLFSFLFFCISIFAKKLFVSLRKKPWKAYSTGHQSHSVCENVCEYRWHAVYRHFDMLTGPPSWNAVHLYKRYSRYTLIVYVTMYYERLFTISRVTRPRFSNTYVCVYIYNISLST